MGRSIKGSLLISQPGLVDPNFRCTVVLVTEHDESGAFGLVLNRPGEHSVSVLWESLTNERCECDSPAFVGGPVQQAAVFLLHTYDDLAVGETPVIPGVFMGSSLDLLAQLLERDAEERARRAPEDEIAGMFQLEPSAVQGVDTASDVERSRDGFRVFCGYAGWGSGQLDRELREGGWLVQPASRDFIFGTEPGRLWQSTMDRAGGFYKFFGLMPSDPELN